MAFEKFIPFENDEYGSGVVIQEYNGDYFIIEAAKSPNSDGTVYKRWGQKFKKKGVLLENPAGEPYVFPWSVKIGSSIAEAMDTLRKIATSMPKPKDEAPF